MDVAEDGIGDSQLDESLQKRADYTGGRFL